MATDAFPHIDYARVLETLGWQPAHLVVAERFCDRFLGMTVRPPVTAGGMPLAMAFPRCASVHTCFMRYPLDIAFIDRGGDITFHGPGQTVCYPILDLGRIGIGLRRYVEILEQSVIDTVAGYGIRGERLEGATGVWICNRREDGTPYAWRKICAIRVRASRFVTMHGLALNVNTDLNWFSMINPCGFTDKGVTSIERETGRRADMEEVRAALQSNLLRLLGVTEARG